MDTDEKAPGGNPEPMGQGTEERHDTPGRSSEPSGAALGQAAARAAVVSLALAEARKIGDPWRTV